MIIFNKCRGGLYYFDTTNKNFSEYQNTYYTFINTVESNRSCFHRQEIKGVDGARILQKLIAWPSTQTLKEAAQKNQTRNCPITTDDISRSESIYGPQISIIQVKAIIRIPDHHKTIPMIPLPPIMTKYYHNVELSMDFYFSIGSISYTPNQGI